MKLLTIIQKNLKIFMRSKVSALIIFLGPLLLVSLIGLSFSNTQLPGVTVGVFAPNYNDFVNSIIQKVEDSKFLIHKYDSSELCSNGVKKGDSAICLVFPDNMDKVNNEVSFIVDYSKINLVFIVVDIVSNRVGERTTELRTGYATDILDKVIRTRDDLTNQKTGIEELRTKQSDSKTSASSALSNLNGINPNTDFGNDIQISDAKSSISTITAKIESAKSKISDSKDLVASSSLSSSEKNTITTKLTDANTALANGLTYIEGNESIASLEYMLVQLDSALNNAKSQLSLIKTKRDSAKADLVSLDGSISESIKTVDDVGGAIDNILARIGSVQSSDAAQLVSPIRTKIEPVTSIETHFNYLFPTLMVLVVMITSVLLSSTLVMNEKKSRSMFRNYITPTGDFIFNLGTFLTSFSAILIQLFIFLFISSVFFETDILSSLGKSSIVLLLITSAFILLGMMIGYIFKSEETYILAAITASTILLFLSSTVMPIESISDSVRKFASYTPFVVSENLLRQVMFFNFGLTSLIPEILVILGYIAVFMGVIYGIHKLARYTFSIKKKEEKK